MDVFDIMLVSTQPTKSLHVWVWAGSATLLLLSLHHVCWVPRPEITILRSLLVSRLLSLHFKNGYHFRCSHKKIYTNIIFDVFLSITRLHSYVSTHSDFQKWLYLLSEVQLLEKAFPFRLIRTGKLPKLHPSDKRFCFFRLWVSHMRGTFCSEHFYAVARQAEVFQGGPWGPDYD